MTIMKKSLICLVALLSLALGFTSCQKDSKGLTDITYFAEITLEGDETMVVGKGSTFVDPGFTAVMKGEDVTDKVQVTSDVDTSTSGVYTVTYSIVNADGFPAYATRTVIVLDLADAVEGFWQVQVPPSQRIYQGGAPAAYKGAFEILIIKRDDGYYFVEDLMAGWYAQGAGYGDDYAMQAIIDIDDAGVITLLASLVPGWGDEADDLIDGYYNAATNTITYTLLYAGVVEGTTTPTIEFDVTLNKVDLGL